jgi:endonuclease I
MNKVALRLIALVIPILAMVSPVQADVLISELCDPQSNYLTDRFIEVYNSGTEAVSLTGWSVIAVGNTADIFTWNLSGLILPGDALVCGAATTIIDFPVDFADDGWSSSNATWNGKVGDGAKLRNNSGTVIDYVVVPTTTFENNDMVRNDNIYSPNPSYNAAEWTLTPVSFPTDGSPGEHNAPLPPVGPTIVSSSTDPSAPLAGDPVLVSAVITDDMATITSVELNWGLAADALNNTIGMTLSAADTYTAVTTIPGQSAGANVYYQISATNDEPATGLSDVFGYSLAFLISIQDIQGTGSVSPYVGQDIITEGVVTAAFSGTWVIQDGSGARSGLWVEDASAPALGTHVAIQGMVQEIAGNTTLTNAVINSSSAGSLPAAEVVTTLVANGEDYEGVLIQLSNATCTSYDATFQEWNVNNSSSSLRVDNLGVTYVPTLGSVYSVTGPLSGNAGFAGVVPRNSGDIAFINDPAAPTILDVEASGPTVVTITFSEALNQTTAENILNYTVSGSSVVGAELMAGNPDQVDLTVATLTTGDKTLTVDGVTDLAGNGMVNVVSVFTYYGGNVPPGYYDGTLGLVGDALKGTLHNIIDGHNSVSYTYLWTAFYSTDAKPDGTVWDMYSDVPGGTPPYVYEFGVDQTGSGATEGTGYNREHSWPQSWYGGASPMYTDLFVLYPTDVRVNGMRNNYAFGEVDSPTWTSLNGCKVGPNTFPGYTGTVFEPIDEFKGDFARAYLYMATRYYTEDGSWDDASPMSDRSQLLPWALAMLLEWNASDPVSQKEINRNDDVYDIQHNRNPYIDRPDFVAKVFAPAPSHAPESVVVATILLHQNVPNPFNPSTTISYELKEAGPVRLEVYDVAGHLVRQLVQETQSAGHHQLNWNGRSQQGQMCSAGVYFYRIQADGESSTRRMLLVK